MNLAEITEEFSVSVNVNKGDASGTFTSKPAFVLNGELYVHPFRHDNHIINFFVDGISIEFSAVKPGEVPFFWKNVALSKKVHDGQLYHVVSASTEGVKLNRRNAFRVFIGIDGTAVSVADKAIHKITVKDISSTGIAIITRDLENPEFKTGEQLIVSYTDEDFYMQIDVECRVVRIFTSEVGYVYGCQFARLYPRIEHYVATRQLKKKKQ